jgi:hypothetical protein
MFYYVTLTLASLLAWCAISEECDAACGRRLARRGAVSCGASAAPARRVVVRERSVVRVRGGAMCGAGGCQ